MQAAHICLSGIQRRPSSSTGMGVIRKAMRTNSDTGRQFIDQIINLLRFGGILTRPGFKLLGFCCYYVFKYFDKTR